MNKKIDRSSIVISGIDHSDYPDFCDAYIEYAEYEDGSLVPESELDKLGYLAQQILLERGR